MRPATPGSPTPASLRLRAGQTYRLWCGRDAMLMIQAGTLQLHATPAWMSEILPAWRMRLQEGQHAQLEHSGWLYIEAIEDSQFLYYAAPIPAYLSLALLCRIGVIWLRRSKRLLSRLTPS